MGLLSAFGSFFLSPINNSAEGGRKKDSRRPKASHATGGLASLTSLMLAAAQRRPLTMEKLTGEAKR